MAAAKKTAETTEEVVDEKTGEITTTGGTALAVADEFNYGDDAGAGFDNQTGEDTSVPFMVVLQPGSPEVQDENGEARAGMWINKTTSELVKGADGIDFIPAFTEHLMVEWVPRTKGGGLVESHAIDSDLAKKVRAEQPLGKYKHPTNENDLIETFYVYGVVLAADGIGLPAVISFSSTHIKPYKDWSFRMRSIVIPLPDGRKLTSKQLPMWAFCYNLKTLKQEKNGNTWFIPQVSFAGDEEINGKKVKTAMASRVVPGSALYEMAKGVYEAIKSGSKKADTGSLRQEDTGVEAAPQKGDTSKEDAPY